MAQALDPGRVFEIKEEFWSIQERLISKLPFGLRVSRSYIEDNEVDLLENLYTLYLNYSGNRWVSQELIKNLMKTAVQIKLFISAKPLSEQELNQLVSFKRNVEKAAKTIISSHEIEFTYNRDYLKRTMKACKRDLTELSANNLDRQFGIWVNFVSEYLGKEAFLDAVFDSDSVHEHIRGKIVENLNKALEDGWLKSLTSFNLNR